MIKKTLHIILLCILYTPGIYTMDNSQQSSLKSSRQKLLAATKTGDSQAVQELIQKNPNIVNLVLNKQGATPLFVASLNNHIDIVNMLLAAGANPNQACKIDNLTPIYAASFFGYPEIVAALLAADADPNQASTTDELTPLLVASYYRHKDIRYTDIVNMLLAAGASTLTKPE